ncbi:hypothetical protein CC2G_015258 [Coprinopsis cinerea AmutBmut pab1-1]|nr:hypothetical protein CC2G_006739 [Coprinopsis cinerea AmutBmut pab1-1]KAG2001481.1 hypothetical protein CC2G_006740 [Coprinopsis cinerea AmutBmut pab1-1]KAG2001520.1 hypothetical protein CC2G_006730 [Coprinopsis cinerea AmutBmut pab1-1]KAG2001521.1 hypothetical protein CC2G_006731 [Coprinopsis cinerea AmutBmut pab1-1]KAG2001693.1 hypothetical protein CC2G_006658 [Coprinopsis cinerea AmutBmut pab1-1]
MDRLRTSHSPQDGEEDSQALAAEGLPHHTTSAACIARLVPAQSAHPPAPMPHEPTWGSQ